MDWGALTAAEIAARVRAGDGSALEVADFFLDRIERCQELRAFLTVDGDRVREVARTLDADRRSGRPLGPLAGVPVAIKDNISTRGVPTTCGSRILAGYVPPFDATAVERLRRHDALPTGKTNLDEFAMGSSGENSAFGATRNPWSSDHVPGGSSSGSAAAVAAGLVPAALGSDTGGSVRQPGSFCGVVGVKPTYGRVSRYGLVAFASSLEGIGVLARTVGDARLVLHTIAGHDPRDSTSAPRADSWQPPAAREAPRLGVPMRLLERGIDPPVRQVLERTVACCRELGAVVEEVELPSPDHALATYYIIADAEASSNLARYDGVRYGARRGAGSDLLEMYSGTRAHGFGPEVKRRIMIGTYVLSAGYYDAFYRRAQRARTFWRRELAARLEEVDAILLPTSPTVAFRLGERVGDPLAMYLADVFTIPASLTGAPALSLPSGFDEMGLPVGMQLVGKHWHEETLFEIAAAIEAKLGDLWRRRPVAVRGERA